MADTILEALNDLMVRIAPEGENIQETLSTGLLNVSGEAYLANLTELNYLSALEDIYAATVTMGEIYQRCCEMARNDSGADQLGYSPYAGTDELKCLNGRRLLGRAHRWLYWLSWQWPALVALFTIQIGLSGGVIFKWLSGAGVLTFGLTSTGALLTLANTVQSAFVSLGLTGMITFFSTLQGKLEVILPQLLCAFYDGCSAQDAWDNIESVIQAQTTWEAFERDILLLVLTPSVVNGAFEDRIAPGSQYAGATSGTDGYEYSKFIDDLGLGLDCSACTGCGHPLPCEDQTGRFAPSDGQYDAEYTGSQWEVDILLVGPYQVDGTIARQSQVTAYINGYRCDEEICDYFEIGDLYDDIPQTRGAHIVISCSVEFSATLAFVALDNEDCGS